MQLLFPDEKEFQPNGDIQIFENEWMEVEVKLPLNWSSSAPTGGLQVPNSFSDTEHGVPHFLCEEIDPNYSECDLDGIKYFSYHKYMLYKVLRTRHPPIVVS